MKPSEQPFTGRRYKMSTVSINPQDNLSNFQNIQHEIDENLHKLISNNDYIPQVESLALKSSRFENLNFLRNQSKKFKSFKCSILKNPNLDESPQRQVHNQTSLSKKSQAQIHQSFLRQSLQKSSLMNKILSQQRKANNFNHLKNSLFQSLNNKQTLNSIHLKDNFQVQNQKMILLLSERPFQRKSSFGIPFGKLKMIKHMKQIQRRNTHLNQSITFHDSKRKNSQMRQNNESSLLTLSQLKKVSLDSLQKSSIRNVELKKIFKKNQISSSIEDRYSQLKDYQKRQNKKTLLTISDDQNDLRSSLGVSIQMLGKKKVRTQPAQDTKSKNQAVHNKNKLQKCQQKIISDLVKLQKIRNEKIISNRGQNQLKNFKTNSLYTNQNKIFINDRIQQNSSKKSKYIIKFKTEPNQNPLQKLKTRISYQIKDDQFNNKNNLIKSQFQQNHQVHGYAKTFQRKNSTQMTQTKFEKDKKIKLQAINHKINYLQKQLSGWDISKQTDIKQNWNLNIF